MRRGLAWFLMAAVAGGGCGPAGTADEAYKGRIAISGAWALYPMVVRWGEEYRKLHPDVRVDVSAGGAGKGMADALSGAADLGMVSRDVNPAEIEKGAWWVSVVKDAVVPTFNAANPAAGLLASNGVTRALFEDIFRTGRLTDWKAVAGVTGSVPIHVFTRSDACGAAETWAKYLGCNQEDLLGTGVYGDPGVAEAVRADRFGVGYNNINFAYDPRTKTPVKGLRVLPIDLDGNGRIEAGEDFYASLGDIMRAIAEGNYPSPPARDLHLVAKGAPERKVVVEFLAWVVTDGQALVEEAGYIALSPAKLKEEMEKLR